MLTNADLVWYWTIGKVNGIMVYGRREIGLEFGKWKLNLASGLWTTTRNKISIFHETSKVPRFKNEETKGRKVEGRKKRKYKC